MISAIAARVRGMVSRAVVNLVTDSLKLQGVQITMLDGQTADDVEHFQHYGYTSVPKPGAEGIALQVGGSAGHVLVICIDDRRYRLVGLAEGEVALYDDLGHRVHLTRTGIVIHGAGHPVTLTNLTKLRVEAEIEATGQIKDLCDSAGGRTMAQMRATYGTHTHNENNAPGGPTNAPNQAV